MMRVLAAPLVVSAVVVAALAIGDHGSDPAAADPAPASGEGTGSTAPRIVSAEEFCEGFGTLAAAQETQLVAASPQAVADLKAAAATLRDLAAQTAMSDIEKAGVAYVVTAFLSLDDDATAQDVVAADDSATVTDEAHAQALAAYVGENCRRPAMSAAR